MSADLSNNYSAREALFLNAWRRGVKLAGAHYFRVTEADVGCATSKWQLCPDHKAISKAIGVLSGGEAAFLAAMFSFYNSDDGQKLLKRAGYPNICDLAAKLDPTRARVITDLFLSYPGW